MDRKVNKELRQALASKILRGDFSFLVRGGGWSYITKRKKGLKRRHAGESREQPSADGGHERERLGETTSGKEDQEFHKNGESIVGVLGARTINADFSEGNQEM
ncbi:hypothetical protein NDU88_002666 [Pleurodeles waltl]|uniref:Uncharacterized protein n=1 Tax=Pleurodeles waltl TaxID=8319 RepID=A0AAV7SFM8_PLEWA|nr:hypothetical protein NDU88_002666 [Pleurodeles waltl]